jgi:2-methylcitrate dehydratase PrpD
MDAVILSSREKTFSACSYLITWFAKPCLMNITSRTGLFISTLNWDSLPSSVQEKARLCLVDSLGAALAGCLARASKIAAAYAAEAWPGDEAGIFIHGLRASAAGAAFANACAANAIDIDDSARYAYGHAGAQLFPTVFALAEAYHLSGAQMLTALVVGYEIAHRTGRAWHASRSVYQACGSWGSAACAAAAANLIGLSSAQAEHALGIAEYFAPNLPMFRDIDHPAMVKHGIEWAALTGILSAELALQGFTGIPHLLTRPEYQEWGQDLGDHFLMVDGVAWKPARYACCGWAHAGVEGACRLVKGYNIPLSSIASIRVEGCHGSKRLGVRLPSTLEEAQFNQAWPIAAMLVDGEIGPEQMLEQRLDDPQLRSLAKKVTVVETEEMENLCRLFEKGHPSGRFASRVTIVLQDGTEIHSGIIDGGLRFPPVDWDRERMNEKFTWLAGFVLQPEQIQEISELLWNFDELNDVHGLTALLAGPTETRCL